jgi:hypothetical protein
MMTNDDINEMVQRAKGGMEGPIPALVNGEPLQVGQLPDGRRILVAADRDGAPMKDGKGEYVVIDPQSGELRWKLARRPSSILVPMKDVDQTVLSVKQLQQQPPGFLAFARAVKPVKKLKKSLQEKVWIFFSLGLAVVAWFNSKAIAAVIGVRRLAMKIVNRLQPPAAILNVKPLKGVEKYLNTRALSLLQNEIKSTLFQTSYGRVAVAQYANMRVPLEPDGSVSEEYIRRWALFLNSMADRGIWRHGVLARPSLISLPVTGLRWEAGLFTFFFSDENDFKRLNEQVGHPVFGMEGGMDASSDWANFPW